MNSRSSISCFSGFIMLIVIMIIVAFVGVIGYGVLNGAFGLLGGNDQVEKVIPLPPPVDAQYPTGLIVQTVGTTEQQNLMSTLVEVVYGQAGGSIGGVAMENIVNKVNGAPKEAQMIEVNWGDWRKGSIRRTESYDSEGRLIEGRIMLQVSKASILQWLTGHFKPTLDRSRLILQYVAPEPGARPVLTRVFYLEEWGTNKRDILALGTAAMWEDAGEIFPEYSRWGFWETHAHPFTIVTQALEAAEERLRSHEPEYHIEDRDSIKEVVGRQTGLTIYRDGAEWGSINFTYRNNFGRMPNTRYVGKGALSRVEWILGDKYYAMSVLSPALSPEPTSLFVFSNSPEVAEQVEHTDYVLLYEDIRNGTIPGVTFAVYGIGHIGKITDTVTTGDGSATVDIGNGGGIYYSVIGGPTYDEITQAHQLMSLMGIGGLKASGNYYAYASGSGNGLTYYLSILRVITAPEAETLDTFGVDVGLLDRIGIPEWQAFAS